MVILVIITVIIAGGFAVVRAAPNLQINYQGKLTNTSDVAVANGSYNLRFKLCTGSTCAAGGDPIWTETFCYSPDSGSTCDGTGSDQRVSVANGLFSTMLGSITSLSSINFNQTLYLEVNVGGSGATPSWETLTPRKILGTVPAAFESVKLGGSTWAAPGAIGGTTAAAGTFSTFGWKAGTVNVVTLTHSATDTRTITFPDATDTVVLLTQTQALTGKTYNGLTLTSAADGFTIAGGTASRTLTVTGADKSLQGTGTTISLGGTLTTANAFTTAGNFALTITSTGTTNATVPAGTVTLVDLSSSQALTTKTISGLTVSTTTGTLTIPAATIAFSGNNATTLTTTGSTSITLPTSGTLAILGANTFTDTQTITYTGTGNALTLTSSSTTDTNKVVSISQTGATVGTDYGIYVANTGVATTNVGGYFSASGATNNYGLIVNAGDVGIGTSTPLSSLHIEENPSSTTTALDLLRIRRLTTGTAAAGLGARILFDLEDAGGTARNAARISTYWNNATTALPKLGLFVRNAAGTPTEYLTIDDAGDTGIGTTTPGVDFATATGDYSSGKILHINGGDADDGNLLIEGNQADLTLADRGSIANQKIFQIRDSGGVTGFSVVNDVIAGYAFQNMLAFDMATGYAGFWTTDVSDFETGGGNRNNLVNIDLSDANTTWSTSGAGLSLRNSNTTANNYSKLVFSTNDGSNTVVGAAISAQFTARTAGAWSTADLLFHTGTAGSAPSEKMRLNNLGYLGLNTTDFQDHAGTGDRYSQMVVTINDASTTWGDTIGALTLRNTNQTNNHWVKLNFAANDGNTVVGAAISAQTTDYTATGWSTTDLIFHTGTKGTAPTEKMRIMNNGKVGIGAPSPASHLQIDGNISASAWTTDGIAFDSNAATFTDTSTAAAGTVAVRTANSFGAPTFASSNAITVTDAFTLYVPKPVAGTNTTITRANSAYFEGNVGIGTTTPGGKLEVTGQYYSTKYTTTTTLDWNNGNVQYIALAGGGQTFTFANPKGGARYMLILKQPSGADGTVTWPATVAWPGGSAPTLTTTDAKVDIITFVYDETNTKYYAGSSLNY